MSRRPLFLGNCLTQKGITLWRLVFIIVVVYFVNDSIRKLLDTPSYENQC